MFTSYQTLSRRRSHRIKYGYNAHLGTAWFEVHDLWREKGNEALEQRLLELDPKGSLYQRLIQHMKESLIAFGGLFEIDIADGVALRHRLLRWVTLDNAQVERIDRDRRAALMSLVEKERKDAADHHVQELGGVHRLEPGAPADRPKEPHPT